jgi:hypothetical protein
MTALDWAYEIVNLWNAFPLGIRLMLVAALVLNLSVGYFGKALRLSRMGKRSSYRKKNPFPSVYARAYKENKYGRSR